MTQTKTARLSLTVSGSLELQNEQLLMDSSGANERADTNQLPGTRAAQGNAEMDRDEENAMSISADETYAQSVHGLQSPASPASPSLTSLPPFPSSPSANSKQSRDASRSLFANLKNSKSSTKLKPQEMTIRAVPHDKSSQEDFGKLPARMKSTPDLRSTSSSEAVPDLPGLDGHPSNRKLFEVAALLKLTC